MGLLKRKRVSVDESYEAELYSALDRFRYRGDAPIKRHAYLHSWASFALGSSIKSPKINSGMGLDGDLIVIGQDLCRLLNSKVQKMDLQSSTENLSPDLPRREIENSLLGSD